MVELHLTTDALASVFNVLFFVSTAAGSGSGFATLWGCMYELVVGRSGQHENLQDSIVLTIKVVAQAALVEQHCGAHYLLLFADLQKHHCARTCGVGPGHKQVVPMLHVCLSSIT
jgi:hypothetical protein